MRFSELASSRYSVRSFLKKDIEEEKLNRILDVGRVAPTACNNQPQRVFVVRSEEMRARLATVCPFTFDAPVILAVCYDPSLCWRNKRMNGHPSGETDAAIVTTHMMLAAWEEGIGSCWVGVFGSDAVKEVLELPENLIVTALMPMGYPAEDAVPAPFHALIRDRSETVTKI